MGTVKRPENTVPKEVIIGDTNYQYYCFPKNQKNAIVAKARLATEELYKMS